MINFKIPELLGGEGRVRTVLGICSLGSLLEGSSRVIMFFLIPEDDPRF